METRDCTLCGDPKPITEFTKGSLVCRTCTNALARRRKLSSSIADPGKPYRAKTIDMLMKKAEMGVAL